jgi:hypothetical protein
MWENAGKMKRKLRKRRENRRKEETECNGESLRETEKILDKAVKEGYRYRHRRRMIKHKGEKDKICENLRKKIFLPRMCPP